MGAGQIVARENKDAFGQLVAAGLTTETRTEFDVALENLEFAGLACHSNLGIELTDDGNKTIMKGLAESP